MTKLVILTLSISLATLPSLNAAPSISAQGVKNAASFADPRLPNGSIAEGSIFNLFGLAMGPTAIAYATTLPLPTTLSGTSVSVTVGGTTVQCYMFYTSALQVAAILPSNTPVGTGTITVSYNGAASPTQPITVVKSSFGIFTVNQQGNGTAVILDGNNNVSSSTFSFQPSETVVAWGTGLGPISAPDNTTPPSGNLPGVSVVVTVGGQPASVAYYGRSGYAGEDQIDFTIPSGVSGCNVPVSITVTSGSSVTSSNWVSMAVSSTPESCSSISSYPPGLGSTSGALRLGTVLWNHSVTTSPTPTATGITSTTTMADQGEASFESYSINPYTNATGFDVPYGTCVIVPPVTLSQLKLTGLDAGPAINVTGNGANRSITATTQVTGSYYNIIGGGVALPGQTVQPLFFTGGSYSFNNGSGGKDVGGFSGTFNVPSTPFTWTNYSSITTVPRSSPLTVNWTGGDPSWDVYLTGSSIISIAAGSAVGVTFECRAHASDGTLTVPVSILQALPASGTESLGVAGSLPLGSLTMIASPTTLQTATVSGLDYFWWEYSVEYQNSDITFQ